MIVFLGDSITQDWPLADLEQTVPLLNRGIAGETTGQMRARFDRDVLARHPAGLHLLGGINDIAGNGGPVSTDEIVANLAIMVRGAQQAGIAVALGRLMPCAVLHKHPHLAPAPEVADVNERIGALAEQTGVILIDYFSPLHDGQGGMAAGFSEDGLHPNAAGYRAVRPALEAALSRLSGASA